MHAGLLGVIRTPRQGNVHLDDVTWCADNGCFGKNYVGNYNWFYWLVENKHLADHCAFATAPDVVGDARATLTRSREWLPRIRRLGYPAALVAQDGLEDLRVPWATFDVLFIGGTTEWKLGPAAADLIKRAKKKGKAVHVGRVNTKNRIDRFRALGVDSLDGTVLTFGPDHNLPRLLRWIA
jgi:hypothetical protein